VLHADPLRRFDGVSFELSLIRRARRDEKQFVASLKYRSKRLRAVIVDDNGVDPFCTCGLRLLFREVGGVGIELLGNPALGDEFFITPSTNQDLFATVDNLATAFESGGATPAAPAALAVMQSTVGQSLLDIDQAMTNLLGVRAEIGARLRAVDRERVVNDGFELQLTGTMSTLRDVDYAEAISLLNQQTIGLNAAQQSYARLQNLNLFRFL
jgi:flagellar hook-associated protein 3 FlgL